MKQKKLLMMAAIWLTGMMAGHAQETGTFSIATLNVDGLPQKRITAIIHNLDIFILVLFENGDSADLYL